MMDSDVLLHLSTSALNAHLVLYTRQSRRDEASRGELLDLPGINRKYLIVNMLAKQRGRSISGLWFKHQKSVLTLNHSVLLHGSYAATGH